MNERQWIAATLEGDKQAFAAIVDQYQVAVYNLAYRLLANASEAEDAAQEAFVRAYTRLATFKPEESFATWLLAITAHHCIDLRRRTARVRLEPVGETIEAFAGDWNPEQTAVMKERDREIRQALDLLPDHYRLIVVLHYWYDMSCAQIGRVAGLNENAVKVRLHRARGILARFLDQGKGHSEERSKKDERQEKETGNNALFKS